MVKSRREQVRQAVSKSYRLPTLSVVNFDCGPVEPWRVELSAGTIRAGAADYAGRYKSTAHLPAPPWRGVRVADATTPNRSPRLGYFSVPEDLLVSLRGLISDPPTFTRDQAIRAAVPLGEYLTHRFGAREPLIVHGLNYAAGHLETVTVNPKTGRYIGLHIDSWDGNEFEERRNARTRISVNIGHSARYLLVLNVAFDTAAELIQKALGLKRLPRPYRVLPALFLFFPEIPVLRIKIEPGEAYVADTDNLIHDASTFASPMPAFHCSFRAYWDSL